MLYKLHLLLLLIRKSVNIEQFCICRAIRHCSWDCWLHASWLASRSGRAYVPFYISRIAFLGKIEVISQSFFFPNKSSIIASKPRAFLTVASPLILLPPFPLLLRSLPTVLEQTVGGHLSSLECEAFIDIVLRRIGEWHIMFSIRQQRWPMDVCFVFVEWVVALRSITFHDGPFEYCIDCAASWICVAHIFITFSVSLLSSKTLISTPGYRWMSALWRPESLHYSLTLFRRWLLARECHRE